MVTPDIDNFIPNNITRSKPIVQKTIPQMSSVIDPSRTLNTNIPENLLVIGNDLELNGGVAVAGAIGGGIGVGGEAVELDRGGINSAAHVGEGGELFESLGGFVEAAATDGDLDEFRVEFGGEEAGDHVGYFGDEVGFEGVAGG